MSVQIPALISAYFQQAPDVSLPAQQVSFGTSGHRGSALKNSFNEQHILAISQAVVEFRKQQGITGPMYVGIDTHALSVPAFGSVLQVLVANGVQVKVDSEQGFTPTPLVSRAIIQYNQSGSAGLADGLIITPSHNPPEDGGIKYNSPDGGPAAADITNWIQQRANALLADKLQDVKRVSLNQALDQVERYDFVTEYVDLLGSVVDMSVLQSKKLKIGVDPMGGASLATWQAIAARYQLDLEIVNTSQAPDFGFMPPDHDGKIRMDCSSSAAMANLLAVSGSFDLAFGNDPDADRHGIVDSRGLLNPNHYLAVCIDYLLSHRPYWDEQLMVGKTLVSSSMIDRVVAGRKRKLYEVPVGFKWFVDGLSEGSVAFAGEESAGASFLTFDGKPWSTDKDGIILCLLAAEIMAVTGKTPHQYYEELTAEYGSSVYQRVDSPATQEQKDRFAALRSDTLGIDVLAGDKVLDCFSEAPGNGASIGGIKLVTENGWLAARPSGTEAICKVYAESFKGQAHLAQLLEQSGQLFED